MQKNILITGATGFIGEHTAHYLSKSGYRVFALVRPESDISYLDPNIEIYRHDGSIENLAQYMKQENIDAVVHIASMFVAEHSTNQVAKLVDSNIGFGTELLQAMAISSVRNFINTSSTWQHFDHLSPRYCPTNLYAATKEAFEKIVDYYVEVQGFRAITLSIFDSYGPGDRRGKLISLLEKFASEQTELNMSAGEQEIGLVHIDDIVRGYDTALQQVVESNEHRHYVLSPVEVYTLREVVELFERQSGKRLNINWGVRPYRTREVMKVWQCGTRLPNWQSQITLEEGLCR